jgi:hypothetical protein
MMPIRVEFHTICLILLHGMNNKYYQKSHKTQILQSAISAQKLFAHCSDIRITF